MRRVVLSLAASSALFLAPAVAQQPTLKLAATSVNVSGPGMSVRIDIFRWSTDHERSQLLTAKRLSPDKPAKLHSGQWGPLSVGLPLRHECVDYRLHSILTDPSKAQTESSPKAPRNVRVTHGVDSKEWTEIQARTGVDLNARTERSAYRRYGG